ncbi:MAG TPA: riboflavin synthase [Bryobacterales bacterium]|nr:riboflavin synthase [Bryobacterales bacterium]
MFTGIIEELGVVETAGAKLVIEAREVLPDLACGSSIAVNGCCLTAVEVRPPRFSADLSPETLARTNLGDLRPGDRVNLERPLTPSSRLGGHFVQGHVDGSGELVSLDPLRDGNWWLQVGVPAELDRYLVFKGSIAIDGISLTIAALEAGVLAVAVIPHTYQVTNLSARRPGDRLNLECDLIAKHVEKLLAAVDVKPPARLTLDRLREEGF